MKLGNAISILRKSADIKQKDFCIAIGISQTSLCQIEKNRKNPSAKTLYKIAKALGVPTSAIHILSLEETDVAEAKRETFKILFPVFKQIIIALTETNNKS